MTPVAMAITIAVAAGAATHPRPQHQPRSKLGQPPRTGPAALGGNTDLHLSRFLAFQPPPFLQTLQRPLRQSLLCIRLELLRRAEQHLPVIFPPVIVTVIGGI